MCAAILAIAVPPSAGAYPAWWKRQAACIHRHESRDWHARTGNGYYGGLQFLPGTWLSAKPRSFPADPAAASRAQQILVAWRVWLRDGGSWREWGTAALCGVR